MGKRKQERGLKLSFGLITCEKCKGERLLARNCDDCGARPKSHEVQFDLQRRVRIVADFKRGRKEPSPRESVDFEDVEVETGRAIDAVLRALAAASRGARTADALVKAFGLLDQLAVDWNVPQPRPSRNRGRVVGQCMSLFVKGLEQFVEAIVAPDMHSARNCERRGNTLFKEAESVQDRLRELDRAEELFAEDDASESLNIIGIEARKTAGLKLSLVELDAKLASGVGWDVASSGMGIQSHVLHLAALNCFDLEHFTSVLSESDKAVGRKGSTLSESDDWRKAHARAGAFLSSALASMHHVIESTGSNEFEVVHRSVESVSTWRDGVLRHALATLLSESIEEYKSLVSKNAGAAIKRAAIELPQLQLNENLSPEIRNAGAHAGFDLADGGVLIDDTWFSSNEFLDKVLAYLETTVATFAGVTSAMTRMGADLTYSEYLTPRDRDSAIALFLGVYGLDLESSAIKGDAIEICATGPSPDWMVFAAALSAVLPDSVTDLVFRISNQSGYQLFETSLAVIREKSNGLSALDTKQAALRMASMISASFLNGSSPWTAEFWAKIANHFTGTADEENLIDWVKDVRELRESARRAHQWSVVDNCNLELSVVRKPASGSADNLSVAGSNRIFGGQLRTTATLGFQRLAPKIE
ncbi:hypothetical protein [Glutamicibacter sp. NPDC087344]|uniref:hypothetical protein n=1 Tax=Glutamicibacter sp. NPDC087344 TaxID=3363994 RepID=UPI0038224766